MQPYDRPDVSDQIKTPASVQTGCLRALPSRGTPLGAICIAPATLTKAAASRNPEVTIGSDHGTAEAIEQMGASHVNCPVEEFVVDDEKGFPGGNGLGHLLDDVVDEVDEVETKE